MLVNRVILIVLDSVGIGALPDAIDFGDEGSNTLGHIAEIYESLHIPNMEQLGIGNIDPANQLKKVKNPKGAFGKAAEKSKGKDTTTGHWEIAGNIIKESFPSFPNGFPEDFIEQFEDKIERKTIGNYAASGTVIINDLGDEHMKSGRPIVYTSADSVFQIAMHEELIPIDTQYEICEAARKLLVGDLSVGRVIARPFIGSKGNYTRTSNRKDFSRTPPSNLLNAIIEGGKEVIGVGKIVDIFAGKGISRYVKTKNNLEGIAETIKLINENNQGLIFTNLVDFDMLYGHRRDIDGYAKCLEEFDKHVPDLLDALREDDLLIITADHGNDPSFKGTDHTREYVPILCYNKNIKAGGFGTRDSFADIAQTISEALALEWIGDGKSFLSSMVN